MDWLPVAAIVGLCVAVLALGWAVVVLASRNKSQQMPSAGERTQQGQIDAPKSGSIDAAEADVLPSGRPRLGFRSPRQAFNEAFMSGDVQSAVAVLPDLERVLGPEHPEYLLCAGALATTGEQSGLQPLLSIIDSGTVDDEAVLQSILASAVQYYVATDREREGLDGLEEQLNRFVQDESRSNKSRSYVANQVQMLYLGVGRVDDALRLIKLAIELGPAEPSYYFNLSIVHEKRQELEQAINAIERCLEMNTSSPYRQHLFQAWDLYQQKGDGVKMKSLKDKLDSVSGGFPP